MSYSTVYGCVVKGSYFSVHHKFSIFEIKYVKKWAKCIFFCLTVYYPPLYPVSSITAHLPQIHFNTVFQNDGWGFK